MSKLDRIRRTVRHHERQVGGTFVEVPTKRADFEARERGMIERMK